MLSKQYGCVGVLWMLSPYIQRVQTGLQVLEPIYWSDSGGHERARYATIELL